MSLTELYLYKGKYRDNRKTKPSTDEIKEISSNILKHPYILQDMEEFARLLSEEGYNAILGKLLLKKLAKYNPIVSQSILMLDFDNNDQNLQYTVEDLLKDEWMLNNASFYYRTYSDNKSEVDKFRVVFHLYSPLTENKQVEEIYSKLFKKYPQADSSVGQTSRIFFGSNRGYEEINFDNFMSLDDFDNDSINSLNEVEISPNGEIIDENLPNYLLMKYKRYDIVRDKLAGKYSQEFPNHIVANEYFKEQDMVELLELPSKQPFVDILHSEVNPSASVYYSEEHSIYFYKCFSESNSFIGDILYVLRKYLGLDMLTTATDILLECTDSIVNLNSELGKMYNEAKLFRNQINKGQLQVSSPYLHRLYRNYRVEIVALLDIMFDFSYYNRETNEVKYLNFISVTQMSKMIERMTGKKVSNEKMWTILNIIVVTELIRKIEIENIPKDILEDLIESQTANNKLRRGNVYEPSIDIFNSERIAKILTENNITTRSLGFEVIYRIFGVEKATRDFPQAFKPLEDNNLIEMSDLDKNLPKNNLAFEKEAEKILLSSINNMNYIFEKDLIAKLAKKTKKSINATTRSYNKLRSDLVLKYNLKRERLTKELYDKFKIKGKYTPKTIIYKD